MFVIAISAGAAHPQCKENVKVVAACFSIHARANIGANSVPIYLWPIGTKRRLGVTGGPSLDDSIKPIYPSNLRFQSSYDDIFGDFEVCPFTPEKEGHLQLVCIQSASHLVVVKHESTHADQAGCKIDRGDRYAGVGCRRSKPDDSPLCKPSGAGGSRPAILAGSACCGESEGGRGASRVFCRDSQDRSECSRTKKSC